MEWVWRGEHYASSRSEYYAVKNQLAAESFPAAQPGGAARTWEELDAAERAKLLKERLKKYTQKVGRVGRGAGAGGCAGLYAMCTEGDAQGVHQEGVRR